MVKPTILTILSEVNPRIDSENADRLLENGLLDSFQIIQLVARLEKAFGLEINADELIERNFESLEAIARLVATHQSEGAK